MEYHVTKRGCWVWDGRTNEKGYGVKYADGKNIRAHRWYYKQYSGEELVDGLVIHHTCGSRLCVNPEHMVQVSRGDHNTMHHDIRRAVGVEMRRLLDEEARRTVYHIAPVNPARKPIPRPSPIAGTSVERSMKIIERLRT